MPGQKKITTDELEKLFDEGGDILDHFDMEKATKRVNVDLPIWLIKALDAERERKGQTRQALMRGILVDYIDVKRSQLIAKKRA